MDFLLIDIEATCWDDFRQDQEQEIIELACIVLDRFGQKKGVFTSLVKPNYHPKLSTYCKKLTGITQAEINRASHFSEVLSRWTSFLDEINPSMDFHMISWGDFDYKILHREIEDAGEEPYFIQEYTDLRERYNHLYGELNREISLRSALNREDLEWTGDAHRALPDTENMEKLYLKYLGEWHL